MKATDNCIEENSTHFIDLFIYRIYRLRLLCRPDTLDIQQHLKFRPVSYIHIRSSSYKFTLIGEAEWYQGHDYNVLQDLRRISEERFETRNLHISLTRIDLCNRKQYELTFARKIMWCDVQAMNYNLNYVSDRVPEYQSH